MNSKDDERGKQIFTEGGAAIDGNVDTGGGDFVGRDQIVDGDVVRGDKIEEHVYLKAREREEKGGCLLLIERGFTFIISFVIGGFVMGIFGALIGSVAVGGEDGAMIGGVIGAILGLGFALVATGNISRFRQG